MKITKRLSIVLKSLMSVKLGEVATDKATLIWDGDDELKAGVEVFVRNEEDEVVPAEDGEYKTEDGKTIVVAEGAVVEIKDAEAEVAPEDTAVEETAQEVAAEEETPAPVDEPETTEEPANEEDRIAALEERINAIVDGINEIVNSIAALEGRIAEVEGKLAKVEAPAANPVDETEVKEEKRTRMSYYLNRNK